MKMILLVVASLTLVTAEPPAYLPSFSNYGTPGINQPLKFYGAPNYRGQTGLIIKPNAQYGPTRPNHQYGVPENVYPDTGYQNIGRYVGSGGHHGEDYNFEPAKYNFEYHVQDGYGNDFGHQEARQGDVAQGQYFVLLPDGRRQIVEYIADQSGYNPQVRYQGTVSAGAGVGYNNGGYPGSGSYYGSGGYQGGYQNGGLHSSDGHQGGYRY